MRLQLWSMDPDCNAQQDAELNPRGCPSSNITHSVESVRKFCVNNIDTVVCENVDGRRFVRRVAM